MNAVVKPSLNLSGITAENVEKVWSSVEPMISKALDHANNEHSIESLLDALLQRRMQLWIGHEGYNIIYAGLTQILDYPTGKKVCEISHLGGERMREWLDHISIIEDWARDIGCTDVNIIGRKGWERAMENYKPLYVTVTRSL